MTWRMVLSKKPGRRGEAFILHNDVFVLKVYRITNAAGFAHHLVDLLNNDLQAQHIEASESASESAQTRNQKVHS